MEWLSTQLKQKREELGLSIEDVVEKTKLHPSAIRDLEAGNFHNINPIYLKGFIKIYAGFLGIDVGQALEEVPAPETNARLKIRIKKEPEPTARRIDLPPGLKRGLIYALIALVAIWLVASVVRFTARKIRRVTKAAVTETKEVMPQKIQTPSSKELTVSLTAKRDFYLRVKVDGRILFEGILDKGAVESWEADEKLEFKISDGSAVYVEVNGQPLPPLTSMRKPIKRLTVTRSGISVEK
ncbi:MAG: DUF4115 domain-containing protein [Candidatus Omnitrophota bacterium]|nr:MAG: DUF4115 domain-containing protein [Candidatus Omnitrophota bacterium]